VSQAYSGNPFSNESFHRVLIEPALSGNNELYVVSGYASPAMIVRHFDSLRGVTGPISLDLQIGMSSKDGVARSSVTGYRSVNKQIGDGRIKCRFNTGIPIHSKIYVWCSADGPRAAFMGSGNYSQTGFNVGATALTQKEVFVEIDPISAFDYVVEVSGSTVLIDDPDFENLVTVTEGFSNSEEFHPGVDSQGGVPQLGATFLLPLVQTKKSPGEVHNPGAGLNWGQRGARNPNEAYLPVPANVRKAKFFPERGVRFQFVTDDGDSFVASVAQQGDKAIETPEDNSIIGSYFRRRLGLQQGQLVTTEDLKKYGSNAVRVSQLSEDLYQLTFEPGVDFFAQPADG
jgi:hypothetical protein